MTGLGESLNSVNGHLSDQQAISDMLQQQRASVSGVSVDEETANLVKFQHAYEASAHVITVLNQMLDTIVNMAQ